MFGLSKNDKKAKLDAEYKEDLANLREMIANTTRSGPYGVVGAPTSDTTLHDLNCDFGYPTNPDFDCFFEMYDRFGIATAVVDIKPDLSWLRPPLIDSSDTVEKEFFDLVEKTTLWNRVKGLDKRQRVGRYAGMFIEVSDGQMPDKPMGQLNGVASITNLKPMYEGQLRVEESQQDPLLPGFGQPTMYSFNSTGDGDRNNRDGVSFRIHPTRLIIAAEGADDGSIYGVSSIKNVFNDCMDLRKICGAGGEGFYQNARSAPVINTQPGFKGPQTDEAKAALETEIDDFNAKWQKKIVVNGMEFNYPEVRLDDPKNHYQDSLNNVSAGSGIPSAILIGQQMGVRASDKDFELLMITIQSRRENFLNELVRDIVDWMMRYSVITKAPYKINWDDLTSPSDDQKLDLSIKMSTANELAFKSGISPVFTEDEIREVAGHEPLEFEIPTEDLDEGEDEEE